MKTFKSIIYITLACLYGLNADAQVQAQASLKAQVKAKLMSNKIDSAKIFSQQLLKQTPTAENFLLAGSVSEMANDRSGADKLYQQALSAAPDSERYKITGALGYVYLNRGDTTSAINYQNMSIGLNRLQPEPHYVLSILYQMKSKPDSMEYHALQAYRLDSARVDYIRFVANAAYQKGDLLSAIKYLKRLYAVRVKSMDRDSNKTKDALSNFYLKIDAYREALPLLNQLVADSTSKDIYFYSLAKCYYNLNNNESALQNISKAMAISKSAQSDYYQLQMDIYQAMGQQSRVVADYVTGDKLGIQGYSGWLTNYEAAISQTKTIYLRLENEDKQKQESDLFTLAKLYTYAKDDNNAVRVLDSYLKLSGAVTDSVYALYSSAYAGLNRLPEAKAAILVALKQSPGSLDYKYLLLSILYRQNDYKAVIDLIQQADQNNELIDPELKTAMLFKSYTMTGDLANAMKYKSNIE